MKYTVCAIGALAVSIAAHEAAGGSAKAYHVVEVPLAQIAADLAAGSTTSVTVAKAYIARRAS